MTEKGKAPSVASEKMWAAIDPLGDLIDTTIQPLRRYSIAGMTYLAQVVWAEEDKTWEKLYRKGYRVVPVTVTWDDRRATRRKP